MWSLVPVVRPSLPEVQAAEWPRTPIDRFLLARLEREGFTPAPDLAPQQLVRRLYLDVWGLPPAPQEVQAFVANPTPEAYAELVDRLLGDVRYAERWARYWLDLVRYADTNGYERDAEKPNAWKYRDWVIQSLHQDKPYDRFVLEQLAGDELPDASPDSLVGTGFLRIGTFDDEPNDPLQYKYEQLDDLIHATSTTFLATTLKCARCHDHKFDPITQRDYYSVLSFFAPGRPAENADVLAFTDPSRDVAQVKLLKGGDPRQEDELVPAGYLSMLPTLQRSIEPPATEGKTTGLRLQLARWITDPQNPLTSRVMVNRLWQHHFGQALVGSPDNFGNTGFEPLHAELLDYLADEFVAAGWRLKPIHRQILLSRVYQLSAVHPLAEDYAKRDAENQYYWRGNRRRIDAEALRDSILSVSGQLCLDVGGPGFKATISADALEGLSMKQGAWQPSPPEQQRRRTVYMFHKRSLLLPLLTVFDFADTTQPCAQRSISTVAPQALALLNNEFVNQQSRALAERLLREALPNDATQQADAARIEALWWLAFGRAPVAQEQAMAQRHLTLQRQEFGGQTPDQATDVEPRAWTSLCHVVFNSNEFIYAD
jgi:hypothetical protein